MALAEFYFANYAPNYYGSQDEVIPPEVASVRFVVFANGTPVDNAIVRVGLEDSNPMVNSGLVSRAVQIGRTDEDGILDVAMIPFSQFTRGGVYRIKVSDTNGRRLHERRVTVPSVSTVFAEDLPDADA